MTTSEPSPIDTVREALERLVPNALQDCRLSEADDAKRDLLHDVGRDILEAMEEHGQETTTWGPKGLYWTPLAIAIAQDYARRVGEVVS